MNCEQVAPYLPGIAGDEIGAETRRWVDAHIETCASCRADAARLRGVAAGLVALREREVTPPAFLQQAIIERVESERSRRYLPISPAVSAELVRVVSDNRDAIAQVAGAAVAAGALYALWRAARSRRPQAAV